jgi:uncharacterized protein (TIGR01777 family)
MARVVVTGATGTIGRAVSEALIARGDEVIALSRDPERASGSLADGVQAYAWATPTSSPPPADALSGATGVVNLLGEPISQRWTTAAKQRIRDSRVLSTRLLAESLRSLAEGDRPTVLVSQSASGYYGPAGTQELDEDSPAGQGFLAEVVQSWEAEALAVSDILRVVVTRTGVVISPSGGALEKMLPFYKAGIGGPVAGGKQYVPWIALDDVVGALLLALDDDSLSGPVNVTAPNPVDNAGLSKALGRVLHRPAVLPVPGFALQLLYGEMSEIVTTGQRLVPRRLEQAGYVFGHPQIDSALSEALSSG